MWASSPCIRREGSRKSGSHRPSQLGIFQPRRRPRPDPYFRCLRADAVGTAVGVVSVVGDPVDVPGGDAALVHVAVGAVDVAMTDAAVGLAPGADRSRALAIAEEMTSAMMIA